MKKNSNTIAQEQEETCQSISDKNQIQEEAIADNTQALNEEEETPICERILYYCDLTGCPIYL